MNPTSSEIRKSATDPTWETHPTQEEEKEISRNFIKRFPEMQWLLQEDPSHWSNRIGIKTDSQNLYNQKYPLLDCLLLSVKCFKTFYKGDEKVYAAFIAEQPSEIALPKKDFLELHKIATAVFKNPPEPLSSNEIHDLIILIMVLKYVSTAPNKGQIFPNITATDPHDFYVAMLQELKCKPEISPTFAKLSANQRNILTNEMSLVDFKAITHFQGKKELYQSLQKVADQEKGLQLFHFSFFIHICMEAGSLGYISSNSSIAYNSNHFQVMDLAKSICEQACYREDVNKIFVYLLIQRANWLQLDFALEEDRVLVWLCGMLNFLTHDEGEILKNVWKNMDQTIKKQITQRLDPAADKPLPQGLVKGMSRLGVDWLAEITSLNSLQYFNTEKLINLWISLWSKVLDTLQNMEVVPSLDFKHITFSPYHPIDIKNATVGIHPNGKMFIHQQPNQTLFQQD